MSCDENFASELLPQRNQLLSKHLASVSYVCTRCSTAKIIQFGLCMYVYVCWHLAFLHLAFASGRITNFREINVRCNVRSSFLPLMKFLLALPPATHYISHIKLGTKITFARRRDLGKALRHTQAFFYRLMAHARWKNSTHNTQNGKTNMSEALAACLRPLVFWKISAEKCSRKKEVFLL